MWLMHFVCFQIMIRFVVLMWLLNCVVLQGNGYLCTCIYISVKLIIRNHKNRWYHFKDPMTKYDMAIYFNVLTSHWYTRYGRINVKPDHRFAISSQYCLMWAECVSLIGLKLWLVWEQNHDIEQSIVESKYVPSYGPYFYFRDQTGKTLGLGPFCSFFSYIFDVYLNSENNSFYLGLGLFRDALLMGNGRLVVCVNFPCSWVNSDSYINGGSFWLQFYEGYWFGASCFTQKF